MTETVTVYGVGDLRDALQSIGASPRQLSYLVTKGYIEPSVRMPGRLGYTKHDLAHVFLMLGPLRPLDPPIRRRVAQVLVERALGAGRVVSEFLEVDLEDTKKDRCPAVVLKVDRRELVADFAAFLGSASGATKEWAAVTPEDWGSGAEMFDFTGDPTV